MQAFTHNFSKRHCSFFPPPRPRSGFLKRSLRTSSQPLYTINMCVKKQSLKCCYNGEKKPQTNVLRLRNWTNWQRNKASGLVYIVSGWRGNKGVGGKIGREAQVWRMKWLHGWWEWQDLEKSLRASGRWTRMAMAVPGKVGVRWTKRHIVTKCRFNKCLFDDQQMPQMPLS